MSLDANAQTGLSRVYTTFRANVPQLFAEIDRTKAKTLGVPLSNIFSTLQAYLGSAYVNDFNKFGRTYQVNIQAESRFRARKDDIARLEVRNENGQMIPLGTLVRIDGVVGPQIITRYNMYPAATINGNAAGGYSSGQALDLMEQMASAKLPTSMGTEWTGMSFQEKAAGNPMIIFALAILFVYLMLCAQYESWSVSLCIILSVPPALLGTIGALAMRAMDVNVYTQIGIVLLIALAAKNAILIVEFAKEERASGKGIIEAAEDAARLRFRPILMTSFSFIFGTFPLVVAQGAGAGSRQALGTAVFGGMIAATVLTVIFVPVYYVVIQRISEGLNRRKSQSAVRMGQPT
jgi:HAE1 family hydrophobic/amphiphilic exporter-1